MNVGINWPKSKKERFARELDIFFAGLTEHKFENELEELLTNFRNDLHSVLYINDADEASQKIIDLEFAMRQKVSDYRKRISVTSPKGFAMSKSNDERIFDTYLNEFKNSGTNGI